jgi:hypothetical protein
MPALNLAAWSHCQPWAVHICVSQTDSAEVQTQESRQSEDRCQIGKVQGRRGTKGIEG